MQLEHKDIFLGKTRKLQFNFVKDLKLHPVNLEHEKIMDDVG